MPATNTETESKTPATVNDLRHSQRQALVDIAELCGCNGGSTHLSKAPASLIKHDLVVKCGRHASGKHGWPSRYALTDAGTEIVRQIKDAELAGV